MMKPKPKHPWDETMVITVMVVSALCVLLLLASYITSSGRASYGAPHQATSGTVLNMINSATASQGANKTICNVICTKRLETCIAAHAGDQLVGCGDKIYGNYSCLCANPARTTGIIPTQYIG
jgi:hypothetical protein